MGISGSTDRRLCDGVSHCPGKSGYLPSIFHQALAQADTSRLAPPAHTADQPPLSTTPEVLTPPDDIATNGANGNTMALIAALPSDP